MSPRRSPRSRAPLAALGGFVSGALLASVLLWDGGAWLPGSRAAAEDCGQAVLDSVETETDAIPGISRDRRPSAASRDPASAGPPRIGGDPREDLRKRQLLIPVRDYDPTQLRSSFDEPRGTNRRHEAMDLLAPRHTPVLAVEDGTVARLFTSKAGGLTIYQFDPSTTYVYYYAHLESYAPGLRDGSQVGRGQVIGYVGTSGNAPANTPHLHFAIFRLTEKKQWWDGVPVDPFEVLR